MSSSSVRGGTSRARRNGRGRARGVGAASWAVLTPAGSKAVADARDAHAAVMREVLLDRIPEDHHEAAISFLTSLLPDDVAGACERVDGVAG